MPEPWTTVRSTYLIRRDWMNLRTDHVVLPTGVHLPEFHVVEYPDWVGILAVTEDDKIVMVEQYRYGINAVTRELPAGRIDIGETALDAGKRELFEETGFVSDNWQHLCSCAPEPAKHSNLAHLFYVGSAQKVGQPKLDDSEDLRVVLLEKAELMHHVNNDKILHGIHLSGILMARHRNLI